MKTAVELVRKGHQSDKNLFCFPFAGAGASSFYAWKSFVPEQCDFFSIQLAGREKRLHDPYATSIDEIIAELEIAILPLLDKPFIFFGHSMGALLAFELMHRAKHIAMPTMLVVSGSKAPNDVFYPQKIAEMSDEVFIARLRHYDGTPEALLQDTDFLDTFLPRLRADIRVLESYQPIQKQKLHCPVLGFCADSDPYAPLSVFPNWKTVTDGVFMYEQYPGGHFFIHQHKAHMLKKIFHYFSVAMGEY